MLQSMFGRLRFSKKKSDFFVTRLHRYRPHHSSLRFWASRLPEMDIQTEKPAKWAALASCRKWIVRQRRPPGDGPGAWPPTLDCHGYASRGHSPQSPAALSRPTLLRAAKALAVGQLGGPHTRGECKASFSSAVPASGSSPRGRGTRGDDAINADHNRFIPAHAGNARRRAYPTSAAPVHPRAHGERLVFHS
jgi:hypothetical protein